LNWRNFHPASAVFWQRVTAGAGSTCGQVLRDSTRVLVTDIESCEFMAGTQDFLEYRRSGIRAVQSTPLRSRSGKPLGMLSTHWRIPHTPTEEDFRLFDVLARQAADLIERTLAEEAIRESEERFRLIANTTPVTIWMVDTEKQCTYVNGGSEMRECRDTTVTVRLRDTSARRWTSLNASWLTRRFPRSTKG
jgi:PAS domain-containing protein